MRNSALDTKHSTHDKEKRDVDRTDMSDTMNLKEELAALPGDYAPLRWSVMDTCAR